MGQDYSTILRFCANKICWFMLLAIKCFV